jgi:hypothetical protein
VKKWKVIFSPDSELQIIDTVEYYNNARKGLGSKFYKAIKVATISLRISHYIK